MAGQHANTDSRVVLSARGLTRDFGGFTAVNKVDLDVRHAEVHALIGPNGAGKTTVFNLLTKFLQPTRGTIHLLGQDITKTAPDKVARMGLVRSFQISAVFPHMSVLDNVRIALQRPNDLAVQFWRPLSALDRLNERAESLIAAVGLEKERDAFAVDLSYGRKRVLEIATTLALDPKVMLRADGRHGPGGRCRDRQDHPQRRQGSGRPDGRAQSLGGRGNLRPHHRAPARGDPGDGHIRDGEFEP